MFLFRIRFPNLNYTLTVRLLEIILVQPRLLNGIQCVELNLLDAKRLCIAYNYTKSEFLSLYAVWIRLLWSCVAHVLILLSLVQANSTIYTCGMCTNHSDIVQARGAILCSMCTNHIVIVQYTRSTGTCTNHTVIVQAKGTVHVLRSFVSNSNHGQIGQGESSDLINKGSRR